MPNDVSFVVPIAPSSGAQKLGQPVPLSNLVVEENRSRSQPAQTNVPRRSSCRSSLWVTSKTSAAGAKVAHHGAKQTAAKPIVPRLNKRRLVIIKRISQLTRPRTCFINRYEGKRYFVTRLAGITSM